MGKLYLGDLEVTNYDTVMELSGITTANTKAIETNATNIAANKTAIEKNEGDIAANKTAIETNAINIAANKTAIETHIADKTIHVTQALLDFINDLDERLKKLEP